MADFLYDNINLGAGAGAINAGITGTILANALNDSGGLTQVDYRVDTSALVNPGDEVTPRMLFLLPNLDAAPTLTFLEPAVTLMSVQSVTLFAGGKTPAGIFEAFYDVTFRRESAAPLSGWFAYPVVTNTDGVAGLFPAITTQ
jgi:hypothetical protein